MTILASLILPVYIVIWAFTIVSLIDKEIGIFPSLWIGFHVGVGYMSITISIIDLITKIYRG